MRIRISGCSSEWEDWFAWYPIKLSLTELVWLEKVKRRKLSGRWIYMIV